MNKKDILFYTFLLIFVVTAVITLLGIVQVLTIKPGYLNTLVGVFVVEIAGAVIALFRRVDFFPDETPREVTESTQSEKTSKGVYDRSIPEAPRQSDLSEDEYFQRYAELEDRFHEQEDFAREMNGQIVTWTGFVNSVSTCCDRYISIQLETSQEVLSNLIHLSVSHEFEAKAFALRKGDRITATGILDTSHMPKNPSIKCSTFELTGKATSNNALQATSETALGAAPEAPEG